LIECEAKLNEFLPGSNCLLVCQYDRRRFDPSTLLDVLSTHPIAAVGPAIYKNIHYISPQESLGSDLPAARLRRSLEHLAGHQRTSDLPQTAYHEVEERVEARTADLSMSNTLLGQQVAQHKHVEDALRESEERYRLLVANVPVVTWTTDSDGRTTFISPNVERVYGYSAQEILEGGSRLWFGRIHPADAERVKEAYGSLFAGSADFDIEYRIQRKDGRWIWLHDKAAATYQQDGTMYAYGVFSDVTERKEAEAERHRLEAKIQDAQKTESLVVLAGGVAHDFNNLLTGILGNASLVLEDLPPESPLREPLETIEAAARRAAELTTQMLAYSGRGAFVIRPVDLSKTIGEMMHLIGSTISKKATIQYELADDLPAVEADTTQMRQVIMNLIANAAEAVEDTGGLITVRTGVVNADRDFLGGIHLGEDLPAGAYVCLDVADTGCGMDEQTRSKMFDPFFSTKFTGRGLGLATVLGIVRSHHGAIAVDCEPRAGTTVQVLLPSTGRPVQKGAAAPKRLPVNWRGSGTILVVDDEQAVRQVASRVLSGAGFAILTASDGREAVEVFGQHADEITVVLLDLTMPEMDGEETFDKMQRFRPDVRVILSSGYTEQEATRQFGGKGLAGFIQKPYRADMLIAKVRDVVEV